MSKAFTKESDAESDINESEDGSEHPLLPQGTKNYITPQGAKKIQDELKHLLNSERPKIVETISWAAGNGDRSENGDYIYGKRRLREIDRRIRFLTKRLDAAELVDPLTQKSDRVLFGSTVTVCDEDNKKKIYKIIGIDETEVTEGKVSWISPIGKALLGNKVGDTVIVHTPKGEVELEILKIEYKEIK